MISKSIDGEQRKVEVLYRLRRARRELEEARALVSGSTYQDSPNMMLKACIDEIASAAEVVERKGA